MGFDAPLLIGSSFRPSASGAWFDVVEPATEAVIGRAAEAGAEDVNAAVEAAKIAHPGWAALPDGERTRCLFRLADEIEKRAEEIVAIEAADTGNTVRRLSKDIEIATANIRYFAGLIPAIGGETARSNNKNLHFSMRTPYGVVARIVPFNHPFMFAAARIAAPLAAGNAVIIKTPEQSPLSSRLLGEACLAALPPGLVNIVHGFGASTGSALVAHAAIKRIGFTGSVETGRLIQRTAAENGVKHVSLELGGKNPMLILPDISAERAAALAIGGMNFAWAGQSCGSTSRVLLHASVYDEVVAHIAAQIDALKVGAPLDRASDMGPVNSARQLEKVERHIREATEDGARLIAGGTRPSGSEFERGYWIRPTAFADVTSSMRLAQDEVFGPVMAIMRYYSFDDAIDIANSTAFGLTASIWTNQLNQAMEAARRIDSGYIWINGSSSHFLGQPFAGRRQSGTGSEEGLEELFSYTETKAINIIAAGPA
jgi:acyl-CoA reductase-like NAD-dependent aldehyde dehydrogenase